MTSMVAFFADTTVRSTITFGAALGSDIGGAEGRSSKLFMMRSAWLLVPDLNVVGHADALHGDEVLDVSREKRALRRVQKDDRRDARARAAADRNGKMRETIRV